MHHLFLVKWMKPFLMYFQLFLTFSSILLLMHYMYFWEQIHKLFQCVHLYIRLKNANFHFNIHKLFMLHLPWQLYTIYLIMDQRKDMKIMIYFPLLIFIHIHFYVYPIRKLQFFLCCRTQWCKNSLNFPSMRIFNFSCLHELKSHEQ